MDLIGIPKYTEADETRPWSQTFTGKAFFYDDLSSNEIDVVDIAHHLSQINRYGGACFFPYSVAQHSALMALPIRS